MLYILALKSEAYHKPTETWHVYKTRQWVRAVSRRHAINKALKTIEGWNSYQDRKDHPDWDVCAEVKILPDDAVVSGRSQAIVSGLPIKS